MELKPEEIKSGKIEEKPETSAKKAIEKIKPNEKAQELKSRQKAN